METFLVILVIILGISTLYFKWESEINKRPYIEIPLNEVLKAAREHENEMDKLGLNITQINQTVNINKIGDAGLVIYRYWLYEQWKQVKRAIKKRN